MKSKNNVEITGRLGYEPRINETAKGTPVANLRIATFPEANAGWLSVVCWGEELVEICEGLDVGQDVSVIGRLTFRKRQDTGEWVTEVTAAEVTKGVLELESGDGNSEKPTRKMKKPARRKPVEDDAEEDFHW